MIGKLFKLILTLVVICGILAGGLYLIRPDLFNAYYNAAADKFTHTTTIKIMMSGNSTLKAKDPVTHKNVQIGEVFEVTLDTGGHQIVIVKLKNEYLGYIQNPSAFYQEGNALVLENLDKQVAGIAEPLQFPGFSSKVRFVTWKARMAGEKLFNFGKEIIDELAK